jgi:hypothetical protein
MHDRVIVFFGFHDTLPLWLAGAMARLYELYQDTLADNGRRVRPIAASRGSDCFLCLASNGRGIREAQPHVCPAFEFAT